MMKIRIISGALVAASVLAGCGSTVKLDETPIESRTPTAVNAGTAGAAGAAGGATASGAGAAGAAGATPLSRVATVTVPPAGGASGGAGAGATASLGRVVYFDFDSYAVEDKFSGLIDGHAKQLTANRSKRLVIEGHTDERGGREYNLALGQKRAAAVAKSLALLGATEAQVEAVSFGKERPASDGHDEAAWAQNRRAEIKDR